MKIGIRNGSHGVCELYGHCIQDGSNMECLQHAMNRFVFNIRHPYAVMPVGIVDEHVFSNVVSNPLAVAANDFFIFECWCVMCTFGLVELDMQQLYR